MTAGHIKSPITRMIIQQFTQAYIKGNIKGPRYWPFERESTSDRWIPLTKGQ